MLQVMKEPVTARKKNQLGASLFENAQLLKDIKHLACQTCPLAV